MEKTIPGFSIEVGWHYTPLTLDQMQAMDPRALQKRLKVIENEDGSPRGGKVLIGADGQLTDAEFQGKPSATEFDEGVTFELYLNLTKPADVIVARVGNPQGKAKPVRPVKADKGLWTHEIPVVFSEKYGHAVTHHPGNYLALIVLDKKGGFEFWEVGIVSQLGTFFLTVQKKYTAACYSYRGLSVVCPQFSGWPELCAVLAEHLKAKVAQLPDMEQYRKPETKPASVPPGQAEVLFWDVAKGFGAVRVWDGRSARVFVSEVAPRPRLRFLTAGEVVTFQSITELPAGQGGFSCDVVGVKPLSR